MPRVRTGLVVVGMLAMGTRTTGAQVGRTASSAASARREGESESGQTHTVLRAVAGVGAGALLGSFMGYFVSQVATSDWENLRADERTSLRRRFTVSGAAIGGVSGLLLRPRAHTRPPGERFVNVPPRTGRLVLTTAELQRSFATSALEAIELERPEWLRTRLRPDSAAQANPLASAVPTSLVVYVGDERVGEVSQLRDIALPEVREMRFYDAHDAARRWHMAHPYGAIEVVPVK